MKIWLEFTAYVMSICQIFMFIRSEEKNVEGNELHN